MSVVPRRVARTMRQRPARWIGSGLGGRLLLKLDIGLTMPDHAAIAPTFSPTMTIEEMAALGFLVRYRGDTR